MVRAIPFLSLFELDPFRKSRPAEEQTRYLFDFHFSNRRAQVRMGMDLRLKVAWGIVQKHRRRIAVTGDLGKGTAFVVTLLLHPSPPGNARALISLHRNSAAGYAPSAAEDRSSSESMLKSPMMIGTATLQSNVKTRNPMEKIAAPTRTSTMVGAYS